MDTEQRIIAVLEDLIAKADALIVSGYDKGVVTERILGRILPQAYERMPVLIDPKLRNFPFYRPATLITPLIMRHCGWRVSKTILTQACTKRPG